MSDTQKIYATTIIQAPSLTDVLAAEGKSITLSVARFMHDSSAATVQCKIEDLMLEGVKNIVFDSSDRQFSFEGDQWLSSYGQSPTWALAKSHRVIVRWRSDRETGSSAYPLAI